MRLKAHPIDNGVGNSHAAGGYDCGMRAGRPDVGTEKAERGRNSCASGSPEPLSL